MNKKVMLVLAIVLMSVMNVKAQGLAEMPSTSFRSTSSMNQSGSTVSTAAVSGYVSAEDYYSSNVSHRSNVRKATFEEGDDDDRPGPEPDPYSPIGDGLLVLLALAGGFAGLRSWRNSLRKTDNQ